MKCCKCGKEFGTPAWYYLKYCDGEWKPLCHWCAYDLKESAGRMRTDANLRYVEVV